MLGYDATKILIGARPAGRGAAPDRRGARRSCAAIEAFGEAFLAELLLGELLLRLDRPAEAEPVLRGVLAGLPRDSEPLPQAAWLLAQALAMQGRQDEANALRAEYGLDDGTSTSDDPSGDLNRCPDAPPWSELIDHVQWSG